MDVQLRSRKDPSWLSHRLFPLQTSSWRDFYATACNLGGFPHAADHLPLSAPFHPHNNAEADAAHAAILRRELSTADAPVIVFTLSYDHDANSSLSSATWDRILGILRFLVEPQASVQLWVDRIDAASRTTAWGISQLLPYVLFPVVRVGSRPDAGFWSNMEGLAAVFGKGLFHDRSLDALVVQDEAPVRDSHFFFSRAATWNSGDAIETFYVHLMYGCLTKYRNHHHEALERLARGRLFINLTLADADSFLDLLLRNERNSMVSDGRFEILNNHRSRTDIPGWQGLKEWITLDRFIHPIPALLQPFRIKGFVNVSYGDEATSAVVHWALKTGWTRRLWVELTHGSREEGKAIWHLRLKGYRQTREREHLAVERTAFAGNNRPHLYRFDSFNIRWT